MLQIPFFGIVLHYFTIYAKRHFYNSGIQKTANSSCLRCYFINKDVSFRNSAMVEVTDPVSKTYLSFPPLKQLISE